MKQIAEVGRKKGRTAKEMETLATNRTSSKSWVQENMDALPKSDA